MAIAALVILGFLIFLLAGSYGFFKSDVGRVHVSR